MAEYVLVVERGSDFVIRRHDRAFGEPDVTVFSINSETAVPSFAKPLTLEAPVDDTDAATKKYVDDNGTGSKLEAAYNLVSEAFATGTAQPASIADATMTGLTAAGSVSGAGTEGVVAKSFATDAAEQNTGASQAGLGSAAAATQPYSSADFPGQHNISVEVRKKDGDEVRLADVLTTAAGADVDSKVYGYLAYRSDKGANLKWRLWYYYRRASDGFETPFTPDISVTNCKLYLPQVYTLANLPVKAGLSGVIRSGQAVAETDFNTIKTALAAATSAVSFNTQKLSGVAAPADVADAARKQEVDDEAAARAAADTAIRDDLASTANGDGASLVGIEDAAGRYAATTAEAALDEVKALVDAMPASSLSTVQTADGVATLIKNVAVTLNKAPLIEVKVTGSLADGTQGACYVARAAFRREAGGVFAVGSDSLDFVAESDATWGGPSFAVNGTGVDVKVTGKAGTTINWTATVVVHGN